MLNLREKLLGPKDSLRNKLANIAVGAAGAIANPVRGVAMAIASGVDHAVANEETPEEKAAKEAEFNRKEIESQKIVNKQMGFESDELGNAITDPKPAEEPKKEKVVLIEGRPAEAPKDTSKRDRIKAGIVYTENRGAVEAGENIYESVGVSGDLGKYQVSPDTLAAWSGPWLGKPYSPEEFKKDPDAQEKFFEEFLNVVDRLELSDDEAAVAWHRGWGELGEGDREIREKRFRSRLKEDIARTEDYLSTFREGSSSR